MNRTGRRRGAPIRRAAQIDMLEKRTMLAFGLTTTTSLYTLDTGAGVTFSVIRGGTISSTVHLGDMSSFKYNGVEYAAPFSSAQRYSHFESGLSSKTVVTATSDPAGNWIKISCDDTTATVGAGATGVIQYYIAHKNDPVIYMATYAPEMLVSSTRYITYLDWNKFPNHPDQSDTSAIHGTSQNTIESGDVFQDPVDGHTHSKYYAENRLVNHVYHGATGPTSGAFMFIGNRESGSGGPFWKDIDFQSTGSAVEMYNIPYSDHSQTEPFRPGLAGPYAIVLTGGSQPTVTPNYTFLDGVGLVGWVSPSQRGNLTGVASGVPAGHEVTVALSNSVAQYWTTPNASGNYTIPNIKPGTYVETLYQDEMAVGRINVTITAGSTTKQNIVDTNSYYMLNPSSVAVTTPVIDAPVFRIGSWDGTPAGFLNSDKITDMHPSDPRMTAWADSTGSTNFIVGVTPDSAWPMAEWKYQNTNAAGPYTDTSNRITFDLTAAQAATALTLRIGITRMDHGRPSISVNGVGQSVPGISTQPTARGVTLGSWRGNNTLYTWNISTSALHAGTNTIDISCASGSGSGGNWLSPWHIYDAVDLVATSSLTNAPVVASITLSPLNPSVTHNTGQTFTAVAKDQFNAIIAANFTWSATSGTVNGAGEYVAPNEGPTDTVFAKSVNASGSTITGQTTVNVVDTSPLAVVNATFAYDSAHTLTFTFNKQNVLRGSGGTDLLLQNLTTGQTVSATAMTYSPGTATWTSPTPLVDGNYRATLAVGAVKDSSGNTFTQDYTFDFFVFAGDANHDRTVDATDLYILASNWYGSGKTFSQGDFNYDGVVDGKDLGILSVRWQQTLAPPPPPAPAQPMSALPPVAASVAKRAPARAPARTAASDLLT